MTLLSTIRQRGALELLFGSVEDSLVLAEANRGLGHALENLPAQTRDIALNEVTSAAAGLLDISLLDLLIAGWRKYRDLTSAARRTLEVPGSSELVRLATHRVTASKEPYVKVLVNGRTVCTIHFGVAVVFDVSAVLAGISTGRLVEVHAGRCDITGTLTIDGIEVAAGQTSLELPGAIPVTPPVRLLPAEDYSADADQPRATSLTADGRDQSQAEGTSVIAAIGVGRGRPARQHNELWEAAADAVAPTTTPFPPVGGPVAPSSSPAGAQEEVESSRHWWEQ